MKKLILFFSFVLLFAKPLIINDYIYDVKMQNDKIFLLGNNGVKIFKNYKLYKHYKKIKASEKISLYKNFIAAADYNRVYVINYINDNIKTLDFKYIITDIGIYEGNLFVVINTGMLYKYDLKNLNLLAKRKIANKKGIHYAFKVKNHLVMAWYGNKVKVFSDELYNHNIYNDEFYIIACKKPTILQSYLVYQMKTHLIFVEPKIQSVDYYSDFDDYLIVNLGGEVVVTTFQDSAKLHIPIKGYANYLGNIENQFYFVDDRYDFKNYKECPNILFKLNFGGLYSSVKYLKKVPYDRGFIVNGKIVGFDSHHIWIDNKLIIKSVKND